MSDRPSFDDIWMEVASVVSQRATCTRRRVGAVLTLDSCIVSTGYNGSPRGDPHCTEVGCDVVHGHCVRCVHAELNAIIQAGFVGRSARGTTLYTTVGPCSYCLAVVRNAGVARIVYEEAYRADELLQELYRDARAGGLVIEPRRKTT